MPDIHMCWEIILVFSVLLTKGFMNKDSWGFEGENSNPKERDLQRGLDICFPRFISFTSHVVMNLETVSSSQLREFYFSLSFIQFLSRQKGGRSRLCQLFLQAPIVKHFKVLLWHNRMYTRLHATLTVSPGRGSRYGELVLGPLCEQIISLFVCLFVFNFETSCCL